MGTPDADSFATPRRLGEGFGERIECTCSFPSCHSTPSFANGLTAAAADVGKSRSAPREDVDARHVPSAKVLINTSWKASGKQRLCSWLVFELKLCGYIGKRLYYLPAGRHMLIYCRFLPGHDEQ